MSLARMSLATSLATAFAKAFLPPSTGERAKLAAILMLAFFSPLSPQTAFAQANSCQQLSNALRTIDRNRDFRNLNANTQAAQNLSRDLRSAEGAFVQNGCQATLNAGQSLSRQCRTAARQILRGRDDLAALETRISQGQTLASQREQIAHQMEVQGCGTNSQANVQNDTRPRNFFEQLFDSLSGNDVGSGSIIGDEFGGYQNYNTVRSVCVRKSDGYYWPISFSTLPDFLQNDAIQCNAQCPGADVDLYYYSNPGQEPKDMVNLSGQPYSALPSAFAYRSTFSRENSCQAKTNYGTIEMVASALGSRAFLAVQDLRVALPLRDPRRSVESVVTVAQVVQIPLPRPRPSLDGSASLVPTPALNAQLRVVNVNGRVVRIVGPDTPYAPTGAEDS